MNGLEIDCLADLTRVASSLGVFDISNVVLKDERFSVWSGSHSPDLHHYGKGGLLQHTWEVAHFSLGNNLTFKRLGKNVDETKLFLAALFHDSGKMYDYVPVDTDYKYWSTTTHKRRVYHLARSAVIWGITKEKFNYKDDEDDVLHAILAHHGRREFGSPVEPATRLAWILHLSDAMSARGDDCERIDYLNTKSHGEHH